MPHIHTKNDTPGIRGLMSVRPDAAQALSALAEALLVADSSLSRGEREMIATFVSSRNQCKFCATSHGAVTAHLPGFDHSLVRDVVADYRAAGISDKLKALLHIAAKVQQGGREVKEDDIAAARRAGANDLDIHDAVLIAASFCMFNRYVDGLGATTPEDPAFYELIGRQRAAEGYLTKSIIQR